MDGYTLLVTFLEWIIRVGGAGILLFGLFKLFQSAGENASGTDRSTGILQTVGGIAAIALSFFVSDLIPPPPGV
jgi:hypothetical protein